MVSYVHDGAGAPGRSGRVHDPAKRREAYIKEVTRNGKTHRIWGNLPRRPRAVIDQERTEQLIRAERMREKAQRQAARVAYDARRAHIRATPAYTAQAAFDAQVATAKATAVDYERIAAAKRLAEARETLALQAKVQFHNRPEAHAFDEQVAAAKAKAAAYAAAQTANKKPEN